MTEKLIPVNARRAAARGFIRTGSQSLATSFVGLGGVTLALTGDGLLSLGVGIAGAVATAALNGAQSYFSILSKGIPEDYAPDTVAAHVVNDHGQSLRDDLDNITASDADG